MTVTNGNVYKKPTKCKNSLTFAKVSPFIINFKGFDTFEHTVANTCTCCSTN